jgi:putative hydrolase of the HAD superfamily
MQALAAVLFDIDDTLCATTDFARQARRHAVEAMLNAGLRAPFDEVLAELEEVIGEFSSNYEHHFDKLLLRLPADASRHLNRALVVAAGVAAYHDHKFRALKPYPGAVELFRDLKATGTRLGIITHGLEVKQAEKLVRLKLVEYLDPAAIFISDQVGINKPNPKLYASALRSMGLPAETAMYVGDNLRGDIAPPKSLGMLTVWARFADKHPSSELEPIDAPDQAPDHVIRGFEDLRRLLEREYGLKV